MMYLIFDIEYVSNPHISFYFGVSDIINIFGVYQELTSIKKGYESSKKYCGD